MRGMMGCRNLLMMLVKIIDSESIKEIFSRIFLKSLHMVKESCPKGQEVTMSRIHNV